MLSECENPTGLVSSLGELSNTTIILLKTFQWLLIALGQEQRYNFQAQ